MKRIITLLLLATLALPQVAGAVIEETVSSAGSELKLGLVSPNGGELWNRNDVQVIKWETGMSAPIKGVEMYEPLVSIDLYKRVWPAHCQSEKNTKSDENTKCGLKRKQGDAQSIFVKHLGSANLSDESYDWKITPDIPDGDNYLISINLEIRTPACPKGANCFVSPRPVWDESDGAFTITDTVQVDVVQVDTVQVLPVKKTLTVQAPSIVVTNTKGLNTKSLKGAELLEREGVKMVETAKTLEQINQKITETLQQLQELIKLLQATIKTAIK